MEMTIKTDLIMKNVFKDTDTLFDKGYKLELFKVMFNNTTRITIGKRKHIKMLNNKEVEIGN